MKQETIGAAPDLGESLTQREVDQLFANMVERMNKLAELSEDIDAGFFDGREQELEAIRDGILGELLEKNPHEAISEVVHSLSLLYEDRTIRSFDGKTRQFATRDNSTNTWLDDHYLLHEQPDGTMQVAAEYRDFTDMGYGVLVEGEAVMVYTVVSGYRIPADPHHMTPDGSENHYHRTLREFYLRALSTASVVVNRRALDPIAAGEADVAALTLLYQEGPRAL